MSTSVSSPPMTELPPLFQGKGNQPPSSQESPPSPPSSLPGRVCCGVTLILFSGLPAIVITLFSVVCVSLIPHTIWVDATYMWGVNQVYLKQTETFYQASSLPVSPETLVIYGGFNIPAWKNFQGFICSIPEDTGVKLGTFAELCDKSSFKTFQKLSTCSKETCEPFSQNLSKVYTDFYTAHCSPVSFRGLFEHDVFYPDKCNGVYSAGYFEELRKTPPEWAFPFGIVVFIVSWVVASFIYITREPLMRSDKTRFQPLPQED